MTIEVPLARRDEIAARLAAGQPVSAPALAVEFDVSEDAVRRDLRALAAQGLCRRVYGGALPISPGAVPMSARAVADQEVKRLLAGAAAKTVQPGEFLFLDSGSTNLALAEFLPEDADLTVATNSVDIAAAILRRQDIRLIVIGGMADPVVGGCIDAVAVQALVRMRFDRAFIGACAISDDGVGAEHFEDASFKRVVLASSACSLILVTNDKIGKTAAHLVASAEQIDMVVIEFSATPGQRAALDAAGCRNILVAGQA